MWKPKAAEPSMSYSSIEMKLRAWNTLLDIAVLLNTWTERLFWFARKHRDIYLDLMEGE